MTAHEIETARASLARDLPAIASAMRSAPSRHSSFVRGLRVLLTAMQGGICAGCGRPLAGRVVELCHVNPSTNARTGYDLAPGGAYAGCKACNTYDQNRTGADIVASMVRPDLVLREWPSPEAIRAAGAVSDVDEVTRLRDAVNAG